MRKILVIGATGFLGGRLARALAADGRAVRCLARDPAKAPARTLEAAGCEVVKGDMSDPVSMQRAAEGVEAAYICVHTISAQPANAKGQDFMQVELDGLRNIVAACRAQGARRLIYVTSLGIAPDGPGAWLQERWKAEQFLMASGLEVTVIRPGQIVGVGGRGFDTMISQAKKPVAFSLFGAGRWRTRGIAVDDLIYYLVGVMDDPRAYGQRYDVGCDELLSNNQMTDIAADILGRRPPIKIDVPRSLMGLAAPQIERMAKIPKGAIRGLVDSMKTDGIGDPTPIRAILPRPPLSYRQAVEQALKETS